MTSQTWSNVRAKVEQEPLNLTPSQAETTIYSGSSLATHNNIKDECDDSSRVSTYTYVSADAYQFTRQEDGRSWNVLNSTYFMPADDEEWARLNKQHIALVLGLGGLYPEPATVRAILAPQEGETKRILDIGCGSGIWTIAMANEFPHAEVRGVDLAPTPLDMESIPSNCLFELDDINLGLAHYAGQFDVVHCRIIGAGLRDCLGSKNDVEACLKPGGMLIWMDLDYDLISENMEDYAQRASDTQEGGSWCARMFHETSKAALSDGGNDIKTMGDVLDEGLWSDALMDPETCGVASLYIPAGPWVEDQIPEQLQRLRYMGALMRQNVSSGIWTFHHILKRCGFQERTLREWSTKADAEMADLTSRTWTRWILAWGRRRNLDGGPAPATAPQEPKDQKFNATYPYLIPHNSREEALIASQMRRHRREAIRVLPAPLVEHIHAVL